MVATQPTAFVQRTPKDEFTVLRVYFSIIELTGLGIQHFTAYQLVILRVIGQAANENQAFEERIRIFPFAFDATESGFAYQHSGDLAVIESVSALVDRDDRIVIAGLVIDGFPIAEDVIEVRMDGQRQRHKGYKENDSFHKIRFFIKIDCKITIIFAYMQNIS